MVAQKDFYILSISIYKVLQLDDENRNMDMKLFFGGNICELSEADWKLYHGISNAVAEKIKDKLTIVDVENSIDSIIYYIVSMGYFNNP